MILLSGADLVLPDRVESASTLVIDGDRIAEVRPGAIGATEGSAIDLRGHLVLPGFVDVHVHGVEGVDTLDGGDAIAAIAHRLTRYGVTGFCPTTVACRPDVLRAVLQRVEALRTSSAPSARVLPAHLESNFVSPAYRGAQPGACLRSPAGAPGAMGAVGAMGAADDFDARAILVEIDTAGDSVGIVTLAPELEGALELIRHLVSRGRRVSLGHSGATLEQSRAAIAAGARRATHLFNRMAPLNHREPGLVGAILTSGDVTAEIICDGVHVHRDMVRLAVAVKGPARIMAITDAVAAAGLPEGSMSSLGGRPIRAHASAAYLEDGTLAGSVATMDRVFRFLVNDVGLPLEVAARLCATTPASSLGLDDRGSLTRGALADLVVMDRALTVRQTYVGGRLVHST